MRGWPFLGRAVGAGAALSVLLTTPALACGGLIGPNGGVSLLRTTTLVGYHAGVEHYVTAFTFTGGTGNFGSITPLPAVPTSIGPGGEWTLQRLERETAPPVGAALTGAPAPSAPLAAQVLQQVTVGPLGITVLKGGGFAVGQWAEDNGFSLPPDAPALLDFYANRSPIFMAAKFNAVAAAAEGQGVGAVTSIQITMPVSSPWVPLAILALGKPANTLIDADVYLLTDHQPTMLPNPAVLGAAPTSGDGLVLAANEPASSSLISDLRADQGGSWIPAGGMWLTYLRLDTPAAALHYDLAIDASGRGTPSARAAGLTVAPVAQHLPLITTVAAPGVPWWFVALIAAGGVVLIVAGGWLYRRTHLLPAA
jgi:hypothetical protein